MADSEDLLDYLELFHFAVRIIGEDLNFLDIFRTGLAKILRSRVERFISELPANAPSTPRLTETSFVHSEAYSQLLTQITNQLRSIIDSIRKAKLWIPQGTGGQHSDPVAIVSNVVDSKKWGIEELHILRSIPTEKLTFSPELTLYYTSLFKASMSSDHFTRLFSYALLRSAPQLFDPRHFFNVLKDALKVWNSQEVTFEFAACLALLMNSICELIQNILDDDIEELIYGLIETIPKSKNFSLLMDFDPTFKWILKSLPMEAIKRVLDSSLDLLKQGSHSHLCLICRSISRGIFGFDVLIPALEASLPFIHEWSKSTRKEAKLLFGTLVTRLPQNVIDEILNLLSKTFLNENEGPTAVLVFSDFIINYMLNTTAPFHEELFDSVQKMMQTISNNTDYNQSKSNLIDSMFAKNESEAAERIFAALCANPVRFLLSVEKCTDKTIFYLPYKSSRTTLYNVLFSPNETSLLSNEEVSKSCNNFLSFASKIDEIDPLMFSVAQIETYLRVSLWPAVLHDFVSKIENPTEEMKYFIIKILYTIAIREATPDIIYDFSEFLSLPRFETEYSEMIRTINSILEKRPTHFEILKSKAPTTANEIFIVGSKTLVGLSLLFQYTIWSEPGSLFACFKRSRINSAEWFAYVSSSLFVSIFENPVEIVESTILKYSNESPLYFVWFAVVILKKLYQDWLDKIADEDFTELVRLMLYPKITEGFTEDDIVYANELHKKYQEMFHRFYNIINDHI
ncbi:hypothetical protein TRFO_21327 [Tritrichomonas foetus]|uniref:Uncharacterized protein n=1 Tax=Tritrichomonas foetus TaxID=1144522 RepID=A0A1J4KFJ7_9EUKA|nr:hypothetical protein TRFO_21327 [Tritrichomonas foetus]|eukprot:OHT09704.1 hypothetical protein TRFO_21327 [Tritrichomonas foetus]